MIPEILKIGNLRINRFLQYTLLTAIISWTCMETFFAHGQSEFGSLFGAVAFLSTYFSCIGLCFSRKLKGDPED